MSAKPGAELAPRSALEEGSGSVETMAQDGNPFSIRMFIPSGDPEGLRIIERSNWSGKALVFPRAMLPEIKTRSEFELTGVYVLVGPREDAEGEMLYVGEGDPVLPRLESHFASKDFWNRAVFFVNSGTGLNKAQVQYLEARLIQLGHEAKRVPLENKNQPKRPTLHEADEVEMEVFLENLLQILPLIGIAAFERPRRPTSNARRRLYCRAKGVEAEGYESTDGFVVLEGSEATSKTVASMEVRVSGYYEMRKKLIDSGVLEQAGDKLRFSQDYSFNSPSAAAAVILGRSANGRIEWADGHGRTLKAIQEEAVG